MNKGNLWVRGITEFKAVKIEQVGRDLNSHPDALVGLASVFKGKIGQTIVINLISAPSYETSRESILVNTKMGLSWMDLIVNFIQVFKRGERDAQILNKGNMVLDLPHRGFVQKVISLCIHLSLVEDVLIKINEGICILHLGRRSLAHRALTQGY